MEISDISTDAELGALMGARRGGRSQMEERTRRKSDCLLNDSSNRETYCSEESPRGDQTNLHEENNIAVDDCVEDPLMGAQSNISPLLSAIERMPMSNTDSIAMTARDETELRAKNAHRKNTASHFCFRGENIRHLRLATALVITFLIIIISLLALLLFNILHEKHPRPDEKSVTKTGPDLYGQDYGDYFDYDYSKGSSLTYSSYQSANNAFYREPGIVYRINPLQFHDSNQDGVGDLNGIRLFIPYFAFIKVRILILHPLIQSSDPFGNEVSDFYGLNLSVGSVVDLKQLTSEASKNNISIAVVINANRVSIDHDWFKNSNASQSQTNSSNSGFDKYRDYFVWGNCSHGSRPNNWVNIFAQSVWHLRTPGDNKCFYSQSGSRSADLNYLNEEVRTHMKHMLSYWTTRGISQFILKDAEYMIETNLNQNEIQNGGFDKNLPCSGRYTYCRVPHFNSRDTPETIKFLNEIKTYVNSLKAKLVLRLDHLTFKSKEASLEYLHRYLNSHMPAADYVILSPFTSFYTDVDKYSRVIKLAQDADLEARGILWESTDVSRNVARIQSRLQFPTNIQTVALSYLMPGLPIMLYGDELGLEGDLYQPIPLYIFNQLPMLTLNTTSRTLTLPNFLTMISSLQITRERYVYKEGASIFHAQKNMVLEIAIELVSSNYLGIAINFGYEPHNLEFFNFAEKSWHFEHKIWSTRKSKQAYDVQISSLEVGEVQIILLTLV